MINPEALENLVRTAMGAGVVVCFTDRVTQGQADMSAPLPEVFGDYPAEFLRIRADLVEALETETGR